MSSPSQSPSAGTAPPATSTVRLRFGEEAREAETHTNLSAVREEGTCLWVAGDETATVERLVADDPSRLEWYGDQRNFSLADLLDLPAGRGDEADVEGLARSGPYLWALGSHSLKRSKIKAKHADTKGIARLAKVTDEANRRVLVRLPVVAGSDGLPELARTVTVDGETRTAAGLGTSGPSLTDELADDVHLAPFLAIPGKDNGFDAEGIAAHGESLYIGLRGPVLRGWAVLLEIAPYTDEDEPHRLRLASIGDDGERYLKHFLDLDGLGIRDLCPDGDDLLVLAGPSMDLDGPVRVYRWHGAARVDASDVVRGEEISRELELPYGEGDDHAEGIALVSREGERQLLVVYDSPSESRLVDGGVVADLFSLPAGAGGVD